MNAIITSSLFTSALFLAAGSVIVYLILLFDKKQRHKLKEILMKTDDVQPILMKRAASQKVHAIKRICESDSAAARSLANKQLDELVAQYDSGRITLPDYCNRLNRLLAMVA